jgi:hypothetical protein
VAASKRNSETARRLRADVPRVEADDRFIAVLADLAASSTPAAAHSRVGKTALRVKIAAVAACVALVSVGAAYGDQFGGDGRAPVEPTDTVDPASPSEPVSPAEPDERFEEEDGDLAPHELDEDLEPHPNGGSTYGDQDDQGLPDNGVEGSQPVAPAPPGQGGQDNAGQNGSDPKGNDPEGTVPAPDPPDRPDHADGASSGPDTDPDDPDTDAEASDAEVPDAAGDPDAARGGDAEVDPS